MSVTGSTSGVGGAGALPQADPAATDALVKELEATTGKGAKILAFLDGETPLKRLAEALLSDGALDAGDVKKLVAEAKDYGKITAKERQVFGTLLRDHAARFTPESREAVARLLGLPVGRAELAHAAPNDPLSTRENQTANAQVASFRDWKSYPYELIVVPGYTPSEARVAQPGVHPVAMKRLEQAKKDFDSGKAPFVFLSGGAVYPDGTPYHEALEMKKALVAMGVPADRVLVDCVARHSTTNLRNAGRYMLDRGLTKALITTSRDQDFYFSHPTISTFHLRCERELGYKLGDLRDAPGEILVGNHSVFTPSPDVKRFNLDDPRDP